MVLSAVGAVLVVGVVMGVTRVEAAGYGHHHYEKNIPVPVTSCPPVSDTFLVTKTVVVPVQETLTVTSINYWPEHVVVTDVAIKTVTSFLPELVTVTPLIEPETSYVTITTPLYKAWPEHHVSTVFVTAPKTVPVTEVQYITPRVVTQYQLSTVTSVTTIVTTFMSTIYEEKTVWKTEVNPVFQTAIVPKTVINTHDIFSTHYITDVVTSHFYYTDTIVATATVPVFVTASCVPAQPVQPGGDIQELPKKAAVYSKLLKVKEYLRDKVLGINEKFTEAFGKHIDKIKEKLDESIATSKDKTTSLAELPSIRRLEVDPLLLGSDKLGGGRGGKFGGLRGGKSGGASLYGGVKGADAGKSGLESLKGDDTDKTLLLGAVKGGGRDKYGLLGTLKGGDIDKTTLLTALKSGDIDKDALVTALQGSDIGKGGLLGVLESGNIDMGALLTVLDSSDLDVDSLLGVLDSGDIDMGAVLQILKTSNIDKGDLLTVLKGGDVLADPAAAGITDKGVLDWIKGLDIFGKNQDGLEDLKATDKYRGDIPVIAAVPASHYGGGEDWA